MGVMDKIKYIVVEETSETINTWIVDGYREGKKEISELKAKNPDNVYRLAIHRK